MKLIGKLLLILFLLTIVYTVCASVVRIYVFNRGIDTNNNNFFLQPNAAKNAVNVYVKNGKIYQRLGSDSFVQYGTTDQNYRNIYYYSPDVPLVAGIKDFALLFNREGSGVVYDISTNSTISPPLPVGNGAIYPITNSTGLGKPSAFDCELFNGKMYCTGFENDLRTQNLPPRAITQFKFNAKLEDNTIINFDSTSSPWTISALNAQTANVDIRTTDIVEGTGAITWDKTAGSTEAGIEITTQLNLSYYADYYLVLWTDAVASGTSTGTYKIRLSTGGSGSDYLEYDLAIGSTNNKYNLIDINSPTATFGSTNLANIGQITIRLTTGAVGNVYTEAAIDALTFYPNFTYIGVPTNTNTMSAATGTAGVLTGSYTYKFSCKTWDGVEGNVGPVSNTVTPTADVVDLSSIDVCSSSYGNIKSRVIYRNRNGTDTYWKIAEITDNVTTIYQDNIPDSSLTILAPTAGDPLNDNSQPDTGRYIEIYNNRVLIGPTEDDDNKIQISDISDNNTVIEPESFPTNNFEIINPNENDGLTGMKSRSGSVILTKKNSIYSMSGTKPGEYFVDKLLGSKGTDWNNMLINVDNIVFFLGPDSFYAISSDDNILDVGFPIRDQLGSQAELSYTSVPLAHAEYYPVDNQIWFMIPSSQWQCGTSSCTYIAILGLDAGLENPVWTKYQISHYNGSSCIVDYYKGMRYIPSGDYAYAMIINASGSEFILYPGELAADGDEGSCTFTALWDTKPLYECGQETSPATAKKFDWVKLIAYENNSIDLTLSWGYGDWDNSATPYQYSQTVSLDCINDCAHRLVYPKIPLSGGSGVDKNLTFRISHVSGVGGATTQTSDQWMLYGYEYKCQDLGGEF